MLEIALVAAVLLIGACYLVYQAASVFAVFTASAIAVIVAVPTAVVFSFGGFVSGVLVTLAYATLTRWGSSIHSEPGPSLSISGWEAKLRGGSWIARQFHSTFNVQIVDSDKQPISNVYASFQRKYRLSSSSATRYVFVMYPHGVIPLGAVGFAGLSGSSTMWTIPTDRDEPRFEPPTLLVHQWLFWIPGIRDLVLWGLGCRNVGRESMNRHLDAKTSIAFLPDGARGMMPRDAILDTRRTWFELLWHRRNRDDIVIVPCATEGETQAMPTFLRLRQWCYRLFKYPFPTFMTRQSSNAPVVVTVGKPIRLSSYDHARDDSMDVAWNAFCDHLDAIGGPALARYPNAASTL